MIRQADRNAERQDRNGLGPKDESGGPAQQDAPKSLLSNPMTYTQTLEAIARIIDPDAWQGVDGWRQRLPHYAGAQSQMDCMAAPSLAKAAQITSLLPITSLEAEMVERLDGAKSALESIYHYTFDNGVSDGEIRRLVRTEASDAIRSLSASPDPDAGKIGPGHICKHGIRWPHPCDQCDAAVSASPTDAGVEGWIKWAGGSNPVGPDTMVEVRLRESPTTTEKVCRAAEWGDPSAPAHLSNWERTGSPFDIVAYRVSPPLPMVKEEGK